MAGKDRYWKEKDGRFYARIAVPKRLQPYLERQRRELIEPLGGDRREARKKLHQAVARLKQELAAAERRAGAVNPATDIAQLPATPITLGDFGRAVWKRYNDHLENDEAARRRFPTQAEIDLAREKLFAKVQDGEVPADPVGALGAAIDMSVRSPTLRAVQAVRRGRGTCRGSPEVYLRRKGRYPEPYRMWLPTPSRDPRDHRGQDRPCAPRSIRPQDPTA